MQICQVETSNQYALMNDNNSRNIMGYVVKYVDLGEKILCLPRSMGKLF